METSVPSYRGRARRRLVPAVFVGLLILAACGGAEEAVEPSPAPPVAAEPAQPEVPQQPDPAPAEPAVPSGEAELVWEIPIGGEDENWVNVVVAHPDGEVLLVGTDATYVVQAADGYLIDAIVYSYPNVDDLAVSPDGTMVGAGVNLGGTPLTTLDGQTPEGLEGLDKHPDFQGVRFHSGFDNNLAFSPDGVHLATGNRQGEVWIWNLQTAQQVSALSVDNPEFLSFLAYHPSGDVVAAIDFNCRVDFWDVASGQVVFEVELGFSACYTERPLAFSPDGQLVASGVTEEWVEFVRVWSFDGMVPLVDFDMDVRNFSDIAFSPDSAMIATAAWGMPPTVWDAATGQALFSLDTGREDVWFAGGAYNPRAITFTPDGGHVAVGYGDGTLELWRLPDAEPLIAPVREACEPLPLPGDVLFDTGSAQLRAEADEALTTLAERLAEGFSNATLTFVGHTDSRGDATANQQLSLARAQAVKDWFATWAAGRGLDWDLQVEGRGESEPKVVDVDANGQFIATAGAINRRVEIEIDAAMCG